MDFVTNTPEDARRHAQWSAQECSLDPDCEGEDEPCDWVKAVMEAGPPDE